MSRARTWTIIAEGSIARRLLGTRDEHGAWLTEPEVPDLQARMISNAACFIYPSESVEVDCERLREGKWHKTKRVEWRHVGASRDFMPALHPSTVRDGDFRPGLWTEAFKSAGDALVAFLRQHPRP